MSMNFSLKPGLKGQTITEVAPHTLASIYGSGGVPVFSTPSLVAAMELAARLAVEEYLPKGYTTVGAHLNVSHLAPTPPGLTVTATATLEEIQGRRLTFAVVAHDGVEKIGEGTHVRYIVEFEKFMNKADTKNHVKA